LFGHLKGAFTGAISNHEGAASLADKGTLFLDEIGELELSLQKSLLRFVQTKSFQKVGSNQVETVDVRIVCATHRDLLAEVKAGRFREDLYYRLDVIHITLPPLRQRHEDILQLARSFLRQFSQDEQKAFQGFTAAAEQRLLEYPWPGNVRELQNTIHHVVVINQGKMITAAMLEARLHESLRHDDIPPTVLLTVLKISFQYPATEY
jgi:two-component system repressor protein LuxO